MINLLIAGYHGFGNCGDEAILKAMTTNIRGLADDVDITALSHNPEFTKTEYNVKSVQRFNVLQVLSAIRNSDIVLSGGGTLLQNGTSTRSLLYYLSLIKLAKLFGKRVMLYANGIGTVTGKLNQRLVRSVINTVDVITLREKLSEADLRNIGVSNPNVTVTADAAFKLEKGKYTTTPVKTSFGYHIILKVDEKEKPELTGELKEEIKTTLSEAELDDNQTLYYETLENIRKDSELTITDSVLEKAYKAYMSELKSSTNN